MSAIRASRLSWSLAAIVLASGLSLTACGDDDESQPATGHVSSHFVPQVDGQDLVQGQLLYTNAAGQTYSIVRLHYLVTDIRLHRADGTFVEIDHAVFGNHFGNKTFDKHGDGADVPTGTYTKISYRWGKEWEGSREATETLGVDFDPMLWPEPNGGGYHGMRFEGNYTVIDPGDRSFLLHMGRLEKFDQVTDTSLPIDHVFDAPLVVEKNDVIEIVMAIELNNWLNDPVYDFTAEVDAPGIGMSSLSGPTMTNHIAQEMMRDNGDDVFSLKGIERF